MQVERMATLLGIGHHRERWPAVRWIEEHISKGDSDFGDFYKDVVEGVKISFADSEFWVEYLMDKGEAACLSLPNSLFQLLDDYRTGPSAEELLLYKMTHPDGYAIMEKYCEFLENHLEKPHSGEIRYRIRHETCSGAGCERVGEVNYHGSSDYEYYCGGSPRCCP